MNIRLHGFMTLSCFLLISCATTRHESDEETSVLINLSDKQGFQFDGKMSFSDGQEGGSGQVDWQKMADQIKVVLKAPLSKKSWTLVDSSDGALLETSDQERYLSESASQLLSEQIGWSVPWKALQTWVTGRPTDHGKMKWLSVGEKYMIKDQGWTIEYSKIRPYQEGIMAHKITAKKAPYTIKLSIKNWQW